MKSIIRHIWVLLFWSCASITPLDGGPKDSSPPVVRFTLPDSAQLNVPLNTSEIILEFDEYIVAKNMRDLLILSPSVPGGLTTKIKGKRLYVALGENLQENTTYSLQLNGSVVDNNEGNILEDYQLYFSTGDYIDSLQYQVRIIHAFERTACEDCIIALYREGRDSAMLLSRPDYIGRTNKMGYAHIPNLAADSFLAVAMKDNNKNLKLDFDELVALPVSVSVSDSAPVDSFYIFQYQRKKDPEISLFSDYPGRVHILFNQPIDGPMVLMDGNDTLVSSVSLGRDSLLAYVDVVSRDTIPLVLHRDSIIDSLWYIPPAQKVNAGIQLNWTQDRSMRISFPTPGMFRTNGLIALQDSVAVPYRIQAKDQQLDLIGKWNYNVPLQLIFPDSFYTDISGRPSAADTLGTTLIAARSTLLLTAELSEDRAYIVQLLREDQVLHRVVRQKGIHRIQFGGLNPGTYRIRIIADANANGRWDRGDIFLRIPAEELMISTEVEVRENWDNSLIVKY